MDNDFSNWQKFWRYTKQTPTPLLDLDKIFTHDLSLSLSRKWMTGTPKSNVSVDCNNFYVCVQFSCSCFNSYVTYGWYLLLFAVLCCFYYLLTMGCCYVMITIYRQTFRQVHFTIRWSNHNKNSQPSSIALLSEKHRGNPRKEGSKFLFLSILPFCFCYRILQRKRATVFASIIKSLV